MRSLISGRLWPEARDPRLFGFRTGFLTLYKRRLSMKRILVSLTLLAGLATLAIAQAPPPARPGENATFGRYTSAGTYAHSDERAQQWQQEQQMAIESGQLAHQLADETNSEKQAELRTKLAGILEKQFDASQKRREAEIAAIEQQLTRLKGTLKKRADARREIIDRRLEQLTREADGLGWSAPENTGAANPLGSPYSADDLIFTPQATPAASSR